MISISSTRRIVRLSICASTVLSLLFLASYILSFFGVARWERHAARADVQEIVVDQGRVVFHETRERPDAPWDAAMLNVGDRDVYFSRGLEENDIPLLKFTPGYRFGFGWVQDRYDGLGGPVGERAIMFPLWLPPILFALGPFIMFAFRVRRRRRLGGTVCARCGYDLRATPHRCPECGMTRETG